MTTSPELAPSAKSRGHLRPLLVLGLPLIGSHLAQFAVTTTDTVMIGWYDVEALGGLVIAGSLYFVTFLVGSGFAWAVMPMVASAHATGDDRQVRRVTRMGMWLSLVFGAFFMLPMFVAEPIFLALGQDVEVSRQAGLYLSIAAWGLIPNLILMVLKSFLSALERTQVILWITIGSAVLNALVNYALIFGNWGAPELGIQGAAIASVTIQGIGMLVTVAYVNRVTPEYALFQNFQRPDWEAFGKVFQLGWPIGLTSLAEVGLFMVSSLLMGLISTTALAAHGIALSIASATFVIHLGLSQAATVRAGNAFGRHDEAHLRRGALVALGLSMCLVVVTIICFLTFPDFLIGLFLDPSEPDRAAIIAIGTVLLALAALFQLTDAAQVMMLGVLRGVQDTHVPMIMATVSYWVVGGPAAYILGFPLGFGAAGIWIGLTLGLSVAAVLLTHRFWTKSSHLKAQNF